MVSMVLQTWVDRLISKRSSLELILSDEQGVKIQATVIDDLIGWVLNVSRSGTWCGLLSGEHHPVPSYGNPSSSRCDQDIIVCVLRWAVIDYFGGKITISSTSPTMFELNPRIP
ncbi:uncharacterized protein LOC112085217 [Eutrema salsugineum]|uniref:uncharacterized protein LOC112085217 n=1 Tax=Eutrema salsugineum TaxID=72664 RepID=UPI000CED3AE1|nr:uncharacterized protein LOC112085217 [Eutrema salsugineum]